MTPLLARQLKKDIDYDPQLVYAVKIVRDDDKEKIIAHQKEFEILKDLHHENIVRAVEVFEDKFKNRIYQVLEFIDGQEILDEIAGGEAYNESVARKVYKQVLKGLAYLHEKGVCHRDIKPSNILVTKEDFHVYIADFNVAKKNETGSEEFKMQTRSAGTLAFAAPERLKEG